MELLPAIDLRGGGAVRLTQGDFDREQRYGDPAALAAGFIAAGARWIHVVDLEAARTGAPHERATLAEIVRLADAASVCVQTGGGIRNEEAAAELLGTGVARVVLGTAAIEDPAFATRCARRWPGRVAVGLDYRVRPDGVAEAQGHGWLSGSGRSVTELLDLWRGEPIGAVVATAVARDGMLSGPDLGGLAALLAVTALPVVASGGVSGPGDLKALAALAVPAGPAGPAGEGSGRRLAGAIVGKALVEGRMTVEEGLAACEASA
jgi:phosphoribosylformimino-5-aminoimidazole carboxamide ribotide isomerase